MAQHMTIRNIMWAAKPGQKIVIYEHKRGCECDPVIFEGDDEALDELDKPPFSVRRVIEVEAKDDVLAVTII